MKIKPEHFAKLQSAIRPLDTKERRALYLENSLSDKRYRWDLTYAAGLSPFICADLYAYLNDDHIDTALRKIVASLIS